MSHLAVRCARCWARGENPCEVCNYPLPRKDYALAAAEVEIELQEPGCCCPVKRNLHGKIVARATSRLCTVHDKVLAAAVAVQLRATEEAIANLPGYIEHIETTVKVETPGEACGTCGTREVRARRCGFCGARG
jgi:hypothetical protein